jgi:hypothetical protein
LTLVPAVGFFNPWTGEEIQDEDEMIGKKNNNVLLILTLCFVLV